MKENNLIFGLCKKKLYPMVEGFTTKSTLDEMVVASKNDNTVTIGNKFISRIFSIENNKLKTFQIKNLRANTVCTPANGSEEFNIKLYRKKDSWNIVAVDSEEQVSENGRAINAVDGDLGSIWHSRYNPTIDGYPHYIVVDLGDIKQIKGFSYTPRQIGDNGNIKDYEFYVSNDKNNFGNAVAKGIFKYNGANPITVNFVFGVSGRYIKLVGLNSVNGQAFASCAELDIIETNSSDLKNNINCSDLLLNDVIISNTKDNNGKIIKFYFNPFNLLNDIYHIVMNVVMKNGDFFIKKYLEIKVEGENTNIDYIDLESIVVDSNTDVWSRPNMEPAYISSYHIALGQPIYIEGMFYGCEFPQTDNRILNNIAFIRYFSGKKFKDLRKTSDNIYRTWQTVVGAARSKDNSVIKSDLFKYIDTIATKTDFRLQYNSWYDFMMNITANNIVGSFYEIEKGLSQFGVEPIDCYVVDDGWNNYDADFWRFNNKFPRELYDSMELAEKFSSTFGLWHGPRGGYNYNSKFGRQMEKAGTGGYNPASDDVCTGHPVYLDKMTQLFLDYQNKFQISYWKLDGFNLNPCPSKNHGHITGGNYSMFFTTEHWEKWIDVFIDMRKGREIQGKNLYINMTSYAVPSPWFLQWVNAVWLQNSNDVGFTGPKIDNSMMDAMITYRDGRYFNFVKEREFQFPLANIYNHDPIYGNENRYNNSLVSMTTDQFEKYLYMLMTRGTGFWELYYSYNLFDDDKWMVNAEVLNWGKKNFHILRNAKLIGETPLTGNVYGYSSWNDTEGIISLRNPSNVTKSFTFVLDRLIGVGEGAYNLRKKTIYPYGVINDSKVYNYGESINITLQPYEVIIWQFGVENNAQAVVKNIKVVASNILLVEFSERILANKNNYSIEGNSITDATILWNRRTVKLTLQNALIDSVEYYLNINGVIDLNRNTLTTVEKLKFYNNYIIAKISEPSSLKNPIGITSTIIENRNAIVFNNKTYELNTINSLKGSADFSISMKIKTTDKNTTVLYQGNEYSLRINSSGRMEFVCKGILVVSKAIINNNTVINITALREKNGMIKIYINGKLDSSNFDKNKTSEDIINSPIMIGDTNFSGIISNLIIRDMALSFNEIKTEAEAII
ncbi:discoidin domain-containing protein [Clostridium tarantellae]|uniref:Alpha-N-acetylgalactosaminidase n=1 Tax=Clostridium tarantellae TaxID=39493 RepID=A0A6I1MHF8_9CLOT|nr:discoidin domain-containing protein [Clostridium tarantellae]MPQ42966.1 alpha-N-acetylgalactosaminidase [Clostridium tarantellae]